MKIFRIRLPGAIHPVKQNRVKTSTSSPAHSCLPTGGAAEPDAMNPSEVPNNRRILVIDDNEAIHSDFRKILAPRAGAASGAVEAVEAALFGAAAPERKRREFLVDSAYQGEEGVRLAKAAADAGKPYAVAFVDVRMPPGWDGIETTEHLWQADPSLLIVICTAYSDYSWERMVERLGESDKLVILKKPFDTIEVIQFAHALTEKWRLARAARMKLKELEAIVAERTASLHQEIEWRRATECKLAKARDEAEAANRAKSAFLANMSHEIRTPMNGILGMCQLLADAPDLPPDHRHLVHTLASSGEVLLALINDILDFSKIEANRLSLEAAPFSLDTLVHDTARLFAAEADGKGIELVCETDLDPDESFHGDAVRLRQILQNFLANAIKFTTAGEIHIDIKCRPLEESAKEVSLSVRDTGIGIAPEVQKRLFQPFTQADSSITRRFGGTGLGLAICRRLVHLMDGEIRLESVPGKGSTFTAVVPLRVVPQHELPESETRTKPVHASPAGLRALIVDDNETNRKFLVRLLDAWSIRSIETEGAASAMKALDAAVRCGNSVDILLLDYHMPDTDGLTFARAVRERYADRSPSALLLTSGFQRPSDDALIGTGISSCLFKPIRKEALYEAICQTIAGLPKTAARTTVDPDSMPDPEKLRVLIAEDNAVSRKVAVLLCDRIGLRSETVDNGREAVQAVKSGTYDLIFMDCQMPEMDGFEATREIRRLEESAARARTPVIAMTAGATAEYKERCLKAGMDEFITKPVKKADLLQIIERFTTEPHEIRA